jgi:hypothetical protein
MMRSRNLGRVADPDPGSGAFLIPGSGIQIRDPGKIWIRDEHPRSFLRELRNSILGKKFLNSLLRIRIRDPESF